MWPSDGIPLPFDHETLCVLSVRMKYRASIRNTDCWDTLAHTHTNTHKIMYISVWNPNICCKYLHTLSTVIICVKIHLTRPLSSNLWISFTAPEAMWSSGWIFNTCSSKQRSPCTHTHPHRCDRATPWCCFLFLFPSAVNLLLLSILRYVCDGYTFRLCLYSLLYIISLSIPRPRSDDKSFQRCLKALLAQAAPPQPGTSWIW